MVRGQCPLQALEAVCTGERALQPWAYKLAKVAVCCLQPKERKQEGLQSFTLGNNGKKRVKRHTRKTRTRAPGESAPLCCPAAATVINLSFCHCSRVGDPVPGVCFSSFLTTIHEV